MHCKHLTTILIIWIRVPQNLFSPLKLVDHVQAFDRTFEIFYLRKDSILIILLFTEFTDCLIENFVKSNMIDLRLTCGLYWSHLFSIFLFLLYIFTTLEQFYHTPLLLLSKQRMRFLPEFSQQHLAQLFFSFSVFLKFCKGNLIKEMDPTTFWPKIHKQTKTQNQREKKKICQNQVFIF